MLSQKEAKKNFGFLFIYFYRTTYRSSLNFVWRIENKRGVVIKEQVPQIMSGGLVSLGDFYRRGLM
ncbi:MAG: hypothetical protein ACLTCN_00645 [Streptococcus salivarius]|jgi:hypothetical protein|uniref:hypothetical protein n=1 Tax=Streptococcus salivarius TaxID=1304 RepID=UPI000F687AD8|nr:hypothetical protein [Streptococcus salivarius]